MKKILFTSALLLGITMVNGQNWEPIQSNSNNYYQFDSTNNSNVFGPDHVILAEKIDSFTIVGIDTIFYPFKKINNAYSGFIPPFCNNYFINSWMGNRIVKNVDSTIFYNKNNFPIIIKSPDSVNRRWTMYTSATNNILEAKIEKFDTISFFNSLDSAVFISLKYTDSLGSQIPSQLNSEKIIISKDKGFLRAYNWNEFSPDTVLNPFLKIDYEPLTIGKVYDFEVGDEFHYEYYNARTGPPGFANKEIISKRFITSDSLEYVLDIKSVSTTIDFNTNPPSQVNTYGHRIDTIIYSNLSQIINPLVPTEDYNNGYTFDQLEIRESQYRERDAEKLFNATDYFDSLTNQVCSKNYYLIHSFIEGCGKITTDYSYANGQGYNINEETLRYYKKGTEIWGIPQIVTGIEKPLSINNQVYLYPNPSNKFIQLETSGNSFDEIQIFTMHGRMARRQTFEDQIDISELKNGLYLLKLIGKNQIIERKFVKQ